MMMGRQAPLPADLLSPSRKTNKKSWTLCIGIAILFTWYYSITQQNMKNAAFKQADNYNNWLQYNCYASGNQVYYFYPVKGKTVSKENYMKGQGPHTVLTTLSDVLYRVQKDYRSQPFGVHHNYMKPAQCQELGDLAWLLLLSTVDDTENQLIHKVSRIQSLVTNVILFWTIGDFKIKCLCSLK